MALTTRGRVAVATPLVVLGLWAAGWANAGTDPRNGLPMTCHNNVCVDTPEPAEDEPSWDCRVMGNKVCGESIDTSTCGPVGNPLGCPTYIPEH